jgi:poly(hydroxyalkanoate) depolymerase family esterase
MRFARIAFILMLGTASSLSQALTSTTTTLSSSQNPSTYGQAVTLTATVSSESGPPPNGETVSFVQGKNLLGTGTLSDGTATLTISTLAAGGADDISAQYPGDTTFASSSSKTLVQVVSEAPTTTSLTSLQNPSNGQQSVTLVATVTPEYSGTATGNVVFYNGSTRLKGVALSGGAASFSTATLPVGTDQISAVYNGNNTFLTSTSNVVNQAVEAATTLNSTMTWDGITRYYQLYVPAVLPANPPLLLMLHGTNFSVPPNNPSTVNWGWQTLANEYGFILAQPASTYDTKSGQWNWNAYFMDASFLSSEVGTCTSPPATGCPDDAGFLRQLIVNLTSQYNVNPNMVYVTGFSSGAQMTERVGVEISDLVAAIAPASGQMEGQQTAPPPVETPGDAVAPVAVQEWHGTLDNELPPCNYGTTNYSGVVYTLDTVDDTYNYWVQQNGCTVQQTTQTLCTNGQATSGLSGNIATSCSASNVEVQFIWEPGVAHSWRLQNNTTRWLFLSGHSKPSAGNSQTKESR